MSSDMWGVRSLPCQASARKPVLPDCSSTHCPIGVPLSTHTGIPYAEPVSFWCPQHPARGLSLSLC